jgi:hypothetical protein
MVLIVKKRSILRDKFSKGCSGENKIGFCYRMNEKIVGGGKGNVRTLPIALWCFCVPGERLRKPGLT